MKINNQYQILTPNGFKNFSGIRKLVKDSYYTISLSNGITLKCSDSHPFICNNKIIEASNLNINSRIDSSDETPRFVVDIQHSKKPIELFDIVNVDGGNIFNVDGIISHNCDFLASGNNVVDLIKLQEIEKECVKDPIEMSEGESLWVWEKPKQGTDYLITADVATGDGSDYSTFHVLDRDTMTQVAEYQDKIGILEFARILVSVATRYNNAQLVVERESYGRGVLEFIVEDGYKNLVYTNSQELYVEVRGKIRNKYYAEEKKLLPGFSTNEKTRILIIGKVELYLNQKYFIPRSVRLINELKTFIWHNGRAEAARGYHDDLVMALGIGLWVRDNSLRWKEENMDLTKKMLEKINTPDKPSGHSPIYTSRSNQDAIYDQWNMRTGRGNDERENLSWLLG